MENSVRIVLVGGLTHLEVIRATNFCVTRQALAKQLKLENEGLLPPPPKNIAIRNASYKMSSVSASECSPGPAQLSRRVKNKRKKISDWRKQRGSTVVTNPEKDSAESATKAIKVKLNPTQKQKLNLKMKTKKSKEDEQYSKAMAEAVFKYQETIE